MNDLIGYITSIQQAYPSLPITSSRLHTHEGQFSDVVIVNEALIFASPRSPHVAKDMNEELPLLQNLQGRLPLPIPNLLYSHTDSQTGELIFMGYPMLPGAPMWLETLNEIEDEIVLDRLAFQLADFLKALHAIPAASVDTSRPVAETPDRWRRMYEAMQNELFAYMRPDAREQVAANFENYLNDPANYQYQPVVRHGDFGMGNILYDADHQTISGIIDWSFAGLGDPAQDVGALLSFGEDFAERCFVVYPEMRATLHRVKFIRSTYALQQALYARRDGNQADFEDGIRDYI